MDDFVHNKLTDWGLEDWIEIFKDFDKERFLRLEDQEINTLISHMGPSRAILKRNLKKIKEEQQTKCQRAEYVSNARPSTSNSGEGEVRASCVRQHKRRSDAEGNHPTTKKRHHDSNGPEKIMSKVEDIMTKVDRRVGLEDNTKFNAFLKKKISDLKTDKRELVGVFGKTGAGKSSLINAVIGQLDLLPSSTIKACTSAMIKVEANMTGPMYEAEIEFITPEDWKDELWCMSNFLKNDPEKEKDSYYRDISDKLAAVYGEEWEKMFDNITNNGMDKKHFKEIPEFLRNSCKSVSGQSPEDLSKKLVQYTRTVSKMKGISQWYWPLVKCVTVKVPNNPLLQHVTLVDLPGCGDRNKSRDKMWKELVGSCSTVWIVTEIKRAASESEPWEILEDACSNIGNGGQCQRIHFICTMTDLSKNWKKDNLDAKEEVRKVFNRQINIKKHFSDECFQVFTVSSTEFWESEKLKPDETEIPKLQEFLRNLNDCHSETLNYVSGAYGILSLMQGARSRGTADIKTEMSSLLEEKLRHEHQKVTKTLEEAYEAFADCLTVGVDKSESSCVKNLRSVIFPRKSSSSFHRTLQCVVARRGVHKPQDGKLINLNEKLSSDLTGSIDEKFRKTFPNEGKSPPFSGVISTFSLDTDELIKKYKAVELQLIFLKTAEQNIQTKLNKIIRKDKKEVYNSLTETVQEAMEDGYKEAAGFSGTGSMDDRREALEKHVHASKDTMFKEAKDVMLQKLKSLMEKIKETLDKDLNESIELSLKTDDHLNIPDLAADLKLVEQYYKLMDSNKIGH